MPVDYDGAGLPEKAKGRTSGANGGGKSDGPIVPLKPPNKGEVAAVGASPAEGAEGRGPTKGNTAQSAMPRTQGRKGTSIELQRVREVARRDKRARFTALLHHVTVDLLRDGYYALKHSAAPGIDGMSWVQYEENLEERLKDLHERVHSGRFQHRDEAEGFLVELKERLQRFGLALHPEKTRLIEFGRYAAENRKKRGEGKPETFDFLGFTHICGKKRYSKGFIVKRKTIAKRLRAKVKEVRQTLILNRHKPIPVQGSWLRRVVQGYINYHAVPGNMEALETFRREVSRGWLHALRRRSQRHRMNWGRFNKLVIVWIPPAKIMHPYPNARFYAKYPK